MAVVLPAPVPTARTATSVTPQAIAGREDIAAAGDALPQRGGENCNYFHSRCFILYLPLVLIRRWLSFWTDTAPPGTPKTPSIAPSKRGTSKRSLRGTHELWSDCLIDRLIDCLIDLIDLIDLI